MSSKSQQGKKSNKKATGLRMVAHAALPTRYGRFTIYGFEGRGPQEEAIALVRGNLNGKTVPLVRVHSHQGNRFSVQISANQRDRFFLRAAALEAINGEAPITRWKRGMRDHPQAGCFFIRFLPLL